MNRETVLRTPPDIINTFFFHSSFSIIICQHRVFYWLLTQGYMELHRITITLLKQMQEWISHSLFFNNCLSIALHLLHDDLLFLWQKHLGDAFFPHCCTHMHKWMGRLDSWLHQLFKMVRLIRYIRNRSSSHTHTYLWCSGAGWPLCSKPRSPSVSGRLPLERPCLSGTAIVNIINTHSRFHFSRCHAVPHITAATRNHHVHVTYSDNTSSTYYTDAMKLQLASGVD